MSVNLSKEDVKASRKRRKKEVLDMAYTQYLMLEELGYKNNGFMNDVRFLVTEKLPKYINSPEGKDVYKVHLVIPPSCRKRTDILCMVGSGSPLFSSVDLRQVENLFPTPETPYFIANTCEQENKIAGKKRFLTINELLSWCITEAKPGMSLIAKSTKIGNDFLRVFFDDKKNLD